MARASQGMPKRVGPAKIACLDFNLQKARMQMGIQVRYYNAPSAATVLLLGAVGDAIPPLYAVHCC